MFCFVLRQNCSIRSSRMVQVCHFNMCTLDFTDWQMPQISMHCVCVCVFSFYLCRCECLQTLIVVRLRLYVGCWVVGSCSLYFHEACSIKRTVSTMLPVALQSTLMPVNCSSLCWLYIIPPVLSLDFLFVLPDALHNVSLWDCKETILRAEQCWTHVLASLKDQRSGWVSLNQYSGCSIWRKSEAKKLSGQDITYC